MDVGALGADVGDAKSDEGDEDDDLDDADVDGDQWEGEEEEEEEEEDVQVEPEKVEPEWKQHMMRDVIETVGGFSYGFDDEHKDTMNSHEN